MARPQKNTIEYFPHYISDGKKMFFIEHKYGNDGYAVWFKLLETLAATENHFIDLNNESDIMFLSAKCRVEESQLLAIIEDLCKLGEFNKIAWDKRIIWSDKFIESVQDAYTRRSNDCMTFEGLCKHLLGLGIHLLSNGTEKDYNNTQTIVDYNKLDKTRPKETIKNESKGEDKKRFAPPALPEVKDYFFEKIQVKKISDLEAEKFIDFYASKNWYVGKNKMKDWQAAVRNWIRKIKEDQDAKKDTRTAHARLTDQQLEYISSRKDC